MSAQAALVASRGVKPAVVCNELFKSTRLCVVFALTGQTQ